MSTTDIWPHPKDRIDIIPSKKDKIQYDQSVFTKAITIQTQPEIKQKDLSLTRCSEDIWPHPRG